MTIHPHQALNGHTARPARPRRRDLRETVTALVAEIDTARAALRAADRLAFDLQNALLDPEDDETDEIGEAQACRIALPAGLSQDREPNPINDPLSAEVETSPSAEVETSPSAEVETSPSAEVEGVADAWTPPRRDLTPRGQQKSVFYNLIGDRAALLLGWFGNNAQTALRNVMKEKDNTRADNKRMLDQIAAAIESGDIRWAGETMDAHNVYLLWLFPYLPPKFARSHDPHNLARLSAKLDLLQELNEQCRQRTRKDRERPLKNGYTAFFRSPDDDNDLETFAVQWWADHVRQRAAQNGVEAEPESPPAEPEDGRPEAPDAKPEDAYAIALDKSKWRTTADMPIIYHGVRLWPSEPGTARPISRTDAEVAFWLAVDYLRIVRSIRGKNPRLDAMELRQNFQYLKKIPANAGVLRGLHWIANIVNNDIGDDTLNCVPPFEIKVSSEARP